MTGETEEKLAVVVGVGPGTGESLCRRFAMGGYRVMALARSLGALQEMFAMMEQPLIRAAPMPF